MIWKSSAEISKSTLNQNITIIYGTGISTAAKFTADLLTKEEWAYSSRIRNTGQRNTWISSHAVLRQVLGTWFDLNPREIVFKKNRFGRPYVAKSNLFFNLSHTDSSFLLGFNVDGKIGVDVEYLIGNEDLASLVEYAFSPAETDYCQNGDLADRFLEIWTLKEAFLKAAGVGLVDNLARINVIGDEGNELDLRRLNKKTFLCPNGETASIVYRNDKTVTHLCFY
jgi:phosphopantetheinyl transferase